MAGTTEVVFQVKAAVDAGECLCLSGDVPELGGWQPSGLVAMTPAESGEWEARVNLARGTSLRYRYVICYPLRRGGGSAHAINRWETHDPARSLDIPAGAADQLEVPVAEFGVVDGVRKVEKGWVTEDTEVRLHLHSDPVTLWDQGHTKVKVATFEAGAGGEATGGQQGAGDAATVPLACPVTVATLEGEDNGFKQQPSNGVSLTLRSYHIFSTRAVETTRLGLELILLITRGEWTGVCLAHVLPGQLEGDKGELKLPLRNSDRENVGYITLTYLLIRPLADNPCDLSGRWRKEWREGSVNVGHRGLGISHGRPRYCTLRENSVASFMAARERGFKYVELDVTLTKDLVPVVFHDFQVVTFSKRKGGGDDIMLKVPVKDLTLEELETLDTANPLDILPDGSLDLKLEDPDETHKPFITFKELLGAVPEDLGFNVEFKASMLEKRGTWEQDDYFSAEVLVDTILRDVLAYSAGRPIVLSCFDPFVAAMLAAKQGRYPVILLVLGETDEFPAYADALCQDVELELNYAVATGMTGVNMHTEEIIKDRALVERMKSRDLVIFTWGSHNNDAEMLEWQRGRGVHGPGYDGAVFLEDGHPYKTAPDFSVIPGSSD